ncbi:hypothetical protein MKW94_010408, partial [Papaver nudicaule]|nr:hypothetical protein [Papaver nudicaule]
MVSGNEVSNKQILFRDYISGSPKETDMILSTTGTIKLEVPEGSNSVLLKNLYLSCDPYMRGRMTQSDSYVPAFVPWNLANHRICCLRSVGFGKPQLQKADYVWGFAGWEQYSLIENPGMLTKINYTDVPLSYYTGILGMTAYAGFNKLASPKKEESVYVSAASGAVGQVV